MAETDGIHSIPVFTALRKDDKKLVTSLKDAITNHMDEIEPEAEGLLDFIDTVRALPSNTLVIVVFSGNLYSKTLQLRQGTPSTLNVRPDLWSAAHASHKEESFHAMLRRVSVRLAEHTEKLPTTLVLSGVYALGRVMVANGAYGNIYRGTAAGQQVALKTIRLRTGAGEKDRKVIMPHACLRTNGRSHSLIALLSRSHDTTRPEPRANLLPFGGSVERRTYS